MFGTLVKNMVKTKKYDKIKEARKYVKKSVIEKFPNYKKNKYIKKCDFRNIYFKHFN
jgi:hypothetical protein